MMFDFMKLIADAQQSNIFADLPKFMSAWTKFMQDIGAATKRNTALLETIDNKLTLLMSETNLTPELHSDVIAMAAADPRNIGVSSNERQTSLRSGIG